MKKLYVIIAIFITINIVNAQYTLTTEEGDTVNNGSVYTVHIEDVNGLNEVKFLLHSETSDDIIFQVTGSTQPEEAENSFCVGMHCYAPNDYTPKQEELNNNEALLDLYYSPHGTTQDAKIDYHIHQYQNENISFSFSVLFTQQQASVKPNFLKNISVYPNPAKHFINVEIPDNKNYNVLLCDITGKILKNFSSVNNNLIINLDGLKNGIYFLKIISDKKTKVVKFIKE